MQSDASTVPSVPLVTKKAFSKEPLEDPRNRTRMKMDETRDLSRRESWTLRDDAKHESLRTRDPESCLHSLGRALESMLYVPQETHEVQDRIKVEAGSRLRRCLCSMLDHRVRPSCAPAAARVRMNCMMCGNVTTPMTRCASSRLTIGRTPSL